MIRGWITLGVVVLLVAKAWGQGGKSTDDAERTAPKEPVAVPAPRSPVTITGLDYEIEMKLVEGKGASGNEFESPARPSDSKPESARRPLRDGVDRSIAPPAARRDSISPDTDGNLPVLTIYSRRDRPGSQTISGLRGRGPTRI